MSSMHTRKTPVFRICERKRHRRPRAARLADTTAPAATRLTASLVGTAFSGTRADRGEDEGDPIKLATMPVPTDTEKRVVDMGRFVDLLVHGDDRALEHARELFARAR